MVAAETHGVESALLGSGINFGGNNELQAICDLLSEEVAAVGNSPVERNSRKVGAAFALLLGPCCNRRHRLSRYSAQDVEQAVVSADCTDFATIVAAFRAEANELKQALEIFRVEIPAFDAGNFTHALGKFYSAARRKDRAAVPDKELQKGCNRKYADDCCHNHRALTIKRAVASRASSGIFENV